MALFARVYRSDFLRDYLRGAIGLIIGLAVLGGVVYLVIHGVAFLVEMIRGLNSLPPASE